MTPIAHRPLPSSGRPPIESPAQHSRRRLQSAFPTLFQHSLTRFTGKAAPGEAPPPMAGPLSGWIACLVQSATSTWITIALLTVSPWFALLLPWYWLVSVNALRRLQIEFAHYAVHDQMNRRRWVNRLVHAMSSTVAMVHCFEDYLWEHVAQHHARRVFTTREDPDAAFLCHLGFVPGLPFTAGWRLLRRTIVSPRFHVLFIRARLHTNFVTATWPRRALSAAWVLLLGLLASSVPLWVFALAVIVPLGPLYHVSALLQFLSEHAWMASDHAPRTREEYAAGCWARIALTPLPPETLSGPRRNVAWARWIAHMLLVQVPWRFGVLAGDLTVHDFHHLYPQERRWWLGPWLRQAAIDEGDPRHMADRELMGPRAAIDAVLRGLESSPLADRDGAPADVTP